MTSRAALDASYGRQGGRVVSWDTARHPVGARLDLDVDPGVEVTVLAHLDRSRYLVRLPGGGALIVPHYATRPAEESTDATPPPSAQPELEL